MSFVRFGIFAVLVAVCLAVPAERSTLSCKMCELVVNEYVDSADKDVNNIKKDFDDECKSLFHSIPFAPQECQKYVDSEIDPIIQELEGGTAPKDACTKLGQC